MAEEPQRQLQAIKTVLRDSGVRQKAHAADVRKLLESIGVAPQEANTLLEAYLGAGSRCAGAEAVLDSDDFLEWLYALSVSDQKRAVSENLAACAGERVSEGPDLAKPPWTIADWLGSSLNEVIAQALRKPFVETCEDLELIRALGTLGSKDLIRQLLLDGSILAELAEALWQAVSKLVHADALTGEELNSKFASEGGVFTMSYGRKADFFNGLEALIGSPSINVEQAMEREHCNEPDSEIEWTSFNYGITTTPKTEWWFVMDPERGAAVANRSQWPAETKNMDHPRQAKPLLDYQADFEKINRRLEDLGEATLILPELIGARLYTGPMFEKYNIVNRGGALELEQNPNLRAKFETFCLGNRYTTTIHVINSALIKLSKFTKVGTVYRGVVGGLLPEEFWKPDEYNVRGAVEFGFLSTTTDRLVALCYARNAGAGMVLEIMMGMVDRGADLSWLSQYPHEAEICFAPLSSLQVVSTHVEGSVLVVKTRLNVNLAALTIDQVISKRRKVVRDMCQNLRFEVNAEKKHKGWRSLVHPSSMQAAEDLMLQVFYEVTQRAPHEFNDDALFHDFIKECTEAKDAAIKWLSLLRQLSTAPATVAVGPLMQASEAVQLYLKTDVRNVRAVAEKGIASRAEVFAACLESQSPEVLAAAAGALGAVGKFGAPHAAAVAGLLDNSALAVRAAAAKALPLLGLVALPGSCSQRHIDVLGEVDAERMVTDLMERGMPHGQVVAAARVRFTRQVDQALAAGDSLENLLQVTSATSDHFNLVFRREIAAHHREHLLLAKNVVEEHLVRLERLHAAGADASNIWNSSEIRFCIDGDAFQIQGDALGSIMVCCGKVNVPWRQECSIDSALVYTTWTGLIRQRFFEAFGAGQVFCVTGVPGSGKTETLQDVFRLIGVSPSVIRISGYQEPQQLSQQIFEASKTARCFKHVIVDEFFRAGLSAGACSSILRSAKDFGIFVCVTSNPEAYASHCPEELRTIGHHIEVNIPDMKQLISALFAAESFLFAHRLGSLTKDFLAELKRTCTKQPHYDFGMRFYKVLVKACGKELRVGDREGNGQHAEVEEEVRILSACIAELCGRCMTAEDRVVMSSLLKKWFDVEASPQILTGQATWPSAAEKLGAALQQTYGAFMTPVEEQDLNSCLASVEAEAQRVGAELLVLPGTMSTMANRKLFLGHFDESGKWCDGHFAAALRPRLHPVVQADEERSHQKARWVALHIDSASPEVCALLLEVIASVYADKSLILPNGELLNLAEGLNLIYFLSGDSMSKLPPGFTSRHPTIWCGDCK